MAQRVVFITGASSGIGLASAQRLQQAGWQVVGTALPHEDASALEALTDVRVLRMDISRPEQVSETMQVLHRHYAKQGLAGLVNNAGMGITGPIESLPLEAWRQQLEVNFFGQIRVIQACLALVRQAQGRVVNVTSILAHVTTPFSAPYCASKAAFNALSDALRMELRPWKIHVASIEPTLIKTAIWQRTHTWQTEFMDELPPDARERYGQRLLTMRESTAQQAAQGISPERVAQVIEHALSSPRPRTRYLIGPEALGLRLLQLLPDRLREQILMRRLKLWEG